MPVFHFHLDQLSFWIGVLTGSLFWFVFKSYRDLWPRIKETVRSRTSELKQLNSAGIDDRLRKEILHRAQGTHLTSRLFPLDEILIQPRLLAPPAQISPDNPAPPDNVISRMVAYLPEWPEFGSHFGVPTLDLKDPLNEGLHMAIVGQPGCGKSVALAYLASQAARQELGIPQLEDYFPVLVHYGEISQPISAQLDPTKPIIEAVTATAPGLIRGQVPGFLKSRFTSGKVILFLDGLDELSSPALRDACVYIERLLSRYPTIRLVTTASSEYWNGLPNPGIRVFALAAWTRTQIAHFLQGWVDCWTKEVLPSMQHPERAGTIDPLMAQSWLMADHKYLSPLEWTLMAWSVCVGDIRGLNMVDNFDATLRRITGQNSIAPIETLAMEMVLTNRMVFPKSKASQYLALEPIPTPAPANPPEVNPNLKSTDDTSRLATIHQLPVTMTLSALVEAGILVERGSDGISFLHPMFTGYLAGRALANNPNGLKEIIAHQNWLGKSLALRYTSALKDISQVMEGFIRENDEPLYRNLLMAARWLKDTPAQTPWRSEAIGRLTELLQREMLPLSICERALAALIISEDVSMPGFFRQLLRSNSPRIAQLAALGCGALGNQQCLAEMVSLLEVDAQTIREAGCLGLVALGSQAAIEAVAKVLVQADEETRRAAAEALSNDALQGHPVLKEGSAVGDILIRRAVVYGLARIQDAWAVELLEKMRIEDSQWIVRNTAEQAIETRQQPNPYIPRQLVNPSMAPWLVAFAARNGMGIPAGTPATEMLLLALKTGEIEERLAALDYLRQMHDREVIQMIFKTIYDGTGVTRESAASILYEMAASGVTIPSLAAETEENNDIDSLREAF